jgi:hyperosmotically inducible protein
MKVVLTTLTLFVFLAIALMGAGPITDESLYDQVRIKIANDRTIGGGNIQVKVTNGVVELTGQVKQEKQKQQAERIARRVKGVKSVENKLRVAPV